MIFIGLALFWVGVPVLLIAVGLMWLWLGQKIFGCILGGC